MGQVMEVNAGDFEAEVLESDTPVLVDFWAEWCGPCRMLSPIIEEVSQEVSDRVKVVKMNVDSNQETAANLGIRSIPTLILFKDGEEADRIVGFIGKEQLLDKLSSV